MSWLRIALYILGFILVAFALIVIKLRFPRDVSVPLSRDSHWLWGHFMKIRASHETNSTHLLINERTEEMGGRPFKLRVPARYLVVFSDPEDIHAFLSDRVTFQRNATFVQAFALISKGMLVLDGDVWHAHRKLVQPAFAPDYLREANKVSNLIADKLLARWETIRTSATPTLEARGELSRAAMDIIGLAAFNQNFNSVDRPEEEMSSLIGRSTKYIQRRVSLPKFLWNWLSDAKQCADDMKVLADFVIGVIKNRQESLDQPHRRTVLDMLLEQRRQPSGDGFLNDQEIKDEIMMLYLAGHETTANTMSWFMLALTEHPEVRVKVQEELKRVLNGSAPSYDDLSELVYLEQVIKETLRLYPVVPLTGRQAQVDTELHGAAIPAGTACVANFYSLHRNPKYWKDPLKFDPDRFHKDVKHTPNSFLPFGDGPKNCVGRAFAMVEAKTILARIYQKYTVSVLEPKQIQAVFTVTLGPKSGLPCTITPA